MTQPHYITQRVGEEYVLVRVDPIGHARRIAAGAAGAALVVKGINRTPLAAIAACLAGGALLYHAVTGRNPLSMVCGKSKVPHGSHKDSPSFADDEGIEQRQQVPADALEEAQMESFPASDAPAILRSETARTG